LTKKRKKSRWYVSLCNLLLFVNCSRLDVDSQNTCINANTCLLVAAMNSDVIGGFSHEQYT